MKIKTAVFDCANMLLAIIISLIITAAVIFFISDEPGLSLTTFLTGPLRSSRFAVSVITTAIPLMFTGLAISFMFQASMFNMCAEGAYFLGALVAAWVATGTEIPGILGIIVPMLAGGIVGAVVCFIPAILKAKLNAGEIVSSIMLNYVVLYFGLYLLNNIVRDPDAYFLASQPLPDSSKLSKLIPGTALHSGLIIAILFVIAGYVFLYHTKIGEQFRIFGQNRSFAEYTGVSASSVIILSQLMGGAIAGMGGSVEIMGMYDRFMWSSLPGAGWNGVIVAILAHNKPQYIPLAALFYSYLSVGASAMALNTDVPSELITVIQALMILLVSAKAMLKGVKQKHIIKEVMANEITH